MKKQHGNLYRATGTIGLITLLALTLWSQYKQKSNEHDHSDALQHGNTIASAPLKDTEKFIPSGALNSGIRIIDYDAYQYRFVPEPLVVYAGESVELRLKSNDTKHGVMIPEINFSAEMPLGKRKIATFKAPLKAGEYPIFCSIFCGSDHGDMRGKLIVLPSPEQKGEIQHEQAHSNN